jgi:hypothetical protein
MIQFKNIQTPAFEFHGKPRWLNSGCQAVPALRRPLAELPQTQVPQHGSSQKVGIQLAEIVIYGDSWDPMNKDLFFSLCFHTEIYTAMAISDRQNPPILDMLGAPEVLKGHQRSHSVWFNKNTDTFSVLMGTLSPHSIRCLIIIFAIKLKHAILLYYIKSHGLSLVSHQHCQQFHGLSPLSQSNV